MAIFIPYLVCALFLAVMYGTLRLSLFMSNTSARRSVYKSGIYTSQTVHTLLLASFGSKNILSARYLPCKTAKGIRYEPCSHILLLHGALVIVTVCREDGNIYNPSLSETWTARVRTRSGREREIDLENPIMAGERKKEALFSRLNRIKYKVPVEHIVIFPSRRVSFNLPRQKEIMSPPEAMRTLSMLDKTNRFSKEQKNELRRLLKRIAYTEAQVAAKKRKSRQR